MVPSEVKNVDTHRLREFYHTLAFFSCLFKKNLPQLFHDSGWRPAPSLPPLQPLHSHDRRWNHSRNCCLSQVLCHIWYCGQNQHQFIKRLQLQPIPLNHLVVTTRPMTQAEEQESLVKRLDDGEVDLEKQEGKSNDIRLAALWRNTAPTGISRTI